MAAKDKSEDTVRLTHRNGGTVVVPKDRAEVLVAGGLFSPEKKSTKSSS